MDILCSNIHDSNALVFPCMDFFINQLTHNICTAADVFALTLKNIIHSDLWFLVKQLNYS